VHGAQLRPLSEFVTSCHDAVVTATTTVQTPPQTTGATSTRGTWWQRRRADLDLVRHYAYDARRFRGASFLHGPQGTEHRRAQIAILAHTLEYGMALRDPRDGFGTGKVRELVDLLLEHPAEDTETVLAAASVLDAYVRTQTGDGVAIAQEGLDRLAAGELRTAGAELVTADGIRSATAGIDFDAFLRARHSIRQFRPAPLDVDLVRRAVDQALPSPSSCNRQTSTVHAYTNPEDIAMRRSMGLGPEHVIITRVGVGILPDDLKVPVSVRRSTDAVFRLNSCVTR